MLKFLENMEAGPNKDHNKLESKDTGSSCDLLYISMDSSQNT